MNTFAPVALLAVAFALTPNARVESQSQSSITVDGTALTKQQLDSEIQDA